MAFNCPQCRRPLYNRRRATCEFCSAAIPAALRLSPGQQTRIDALKQADRSRHRDAMNQNLPGGDSGGDFLIGGDSGGGCDGGGGGDCGCG